MTARVGAIAFAVVADALRRKVIWVVLLFAAVMAVAIPALPSYGVGVAEQMFREVAQSLMYVAALVLALALSANRVPQEVERRTVFNVLSRDVRRWEYLAGTWLGVFIVTAAAVACFCAVTQAVALGVYGDPMWRLWEGALATAFECGVIAAVATAVSTRFGAVTVVVAALGAVFVGHTHTSLASIVPEPVLGYLPSLDVFSISTAVAHGSGITAVYAALMAAAFVAWVALVLLAGAVAFAGRDL